MEARLRQAKACRFAGILGLVLMVGMTHPTLGWSAEMRDAMKGPLDGKTFAVNTGDKGKGGSDKDTIVFRNGMFRSMACDKYGFGEGAYSATEKDGVVYFEADTASPSKGKIHWNGTVKDDKIELSYTWTDSSHWYKPNPKPVEKWGRGELKKP